MVRLIVLLLVSLLHGATDASWLRIDKDTTSNDGEAVDPHWNPQSHSVGTSWTVPGFVDVAALFFGRDAPQSNESNQPLRSLEETNEEIRINCGSDEVYIDNHKNEHTWNRDGFFAGGSVLLRRFQTVEDTDDPKLYQTSRQTSSSFSYDFSVAPDDYAVVLHFAETVYKTAGDRLFDIRIEGRLYYKDFDIVKKAGGSNIAVQLRRKIAVEDGVLNIVLTSKRQNAIISAIEIIPLLRQPTTSPPISPTNRPIPQPTKKPVPAPTKVPNPAPTRAPLVSPTKAPVPVPRPVPAPVPKPVLAPMPRPVPVALPRPVPAPIPVPVPRPVIAPFTIVSSPVNTQRFQPIRINAGGRAYTDTLGHLWVRDQYAIGGSIYSRYFNIGGTTDDPLFATEKQGSFRYEIELAVANYEVVFHFAETDYANRGERVFSIHVQGEPVFPDFDILDMAEGKKFQAISIETVAVVADGKLKIEFEDRGKGTPKLNALEVLYLEPHLAHAVTNGPYVGVDADNDGSADVVLDGTTSHTHGLGLKLISWQWIIDNQVRATTETATITLPIGKHVATLLVKDSGGNENAESTEIEIVSSDFPKISSITPSKGSSLGGDQIVLKGTGFGNPGSGDPLVVHFGGTVLRGSDLDFVNSSTIRFKSPIVAVGAPVAVTVETKVGESGFVTFTYLNGAPILFDSDMITSIPNPTTVAFGPDEKLYVGTVKGHLYKLTLNNRYNVVQMVNSTAIASLEDGGRMILGITFDPLDTSENPSVYVSHSKGFHGAINSSSGPSINGKVSVLSGATLATVRHVVTGLPVSDHDHAVNGLDFGDHGELYIQVAGNTNSGVPGRLSTTRLLKDNVVSGATLVADLSAPGFTGNLQYDALDNGNLLPGSGVEIFANGLRNPYDVVYHSNGKVYATDNGPDLNFGDRSASCSSVLPDVEEPDKLLLLQRGGYYGYPNRKRGANDARQCVWRSADDSTSQNGYTAPLVTHPSSIDGIVEFQTNHFDGQLRGNLIIAKYKKDLYRAILDSTGEALIPQSKPLIALGIGKHSLDVTQAPDGSLVVAQYLTNGIAVYTPSEAATTAMKLHGVFPRRGAGGHRLSIFGVNLSNIAVVRLGGNTDCTIVSKTADKITCDLPAKVVTTVLSLDLQVFDSSSTTSATATLERAYRYIPGKYI